MSNLLNYLMVYYNLIHFYHRIIIIVVLLVYQTLHILKNDITVLHILLLELIVAYLNQKLFVFWFVIYCCQCRSCSNHFFIKKKKKKKWQNFGKKSGLIDVEYFVFSYLFIVTLICWFSWIITVSNVHVLLLLLLPYMHQH